MSVEESNAVITAAALDGKDTGTQEKGVCVNETSIENLSNGFLKLYADDLNIISEPLNELRRNQEVLLDTICQENERFVEAKESLKLDDMFSKVVQYQTKLVSIKKDMVTLHERTAKLKKRAMKLQQLKQKQSGTNLEN